MHLTQSLTNIFEWEMQFTEAANIAGVNTANDAQIRV